MTSYLKLNFIHTLQYNSPGIYSAALEVVNPEFSTQEGERNNFITDCGTFSLGTDDAPNNKYLTLGDAATAIYDNNKVSILTRLNSFLTSIKAPKYDDTQLVGSGTNLYDAFSDISDLQSDVTALQSATTSKFNTSTISLAAGVTDSINATITMKDSGGATVTGVQRVEVYISEGSTGIGLTADSASGDLTASTGTILTVLTTKKHIIANTDANGVLVLNLVDSAKPADQYFAVVRPFGSLFVSAASGTNWGA